MWEVVVSDCGLWWKEIVVCECGVDVAEIDFGD